MSDLIQLYRDTAWLQQVTFILGGIVLGILTELFLVRALRAAAKRTQSTWDDLFIKAIHWMPIIWWTVAGVWAAVQLQSVGDDTQQLVNRILVAVLIGSFTIVVMRLTTGGVSRFAASTGAALPSTSLVDNLIRLLVGMLGMFLILQNLQVEITPLITALGVGGLAVALALQDTLGNLFAGVSVIFSGQVRTNDYVSLASGQEGFVTDVKARNTTIRTFPHNNLVVVPNSVLASTILTNYNLPQRSLLLTVPVGVSYDSDLAHVERVAIEVATEVLESIEGRAPATKPTVRYREFADSSINFNVLISAKQFTDQFLIRHEFIKRLHVRFNEEGIVIPFPIRTVYMHQES